MGVYRCVISEYRIDPWSDPGAWCVTWLPIETIVRNHQQEYYRVLSFCDKAGSSTLFIEFMLQRIYEACGGVGGGAKELDRMIFDLLSSTKEPMRAPDIAQLLQSPKRTVERSLARLKKSNRICFVGSSRYGHYKLSEYTR